jgi:hypothetical protein
LPLVVCAVFGLTGAAASFPAIVVHSRTYHRLTVAARYIRIGFGKLLCYLGRISLEGQDRAIDRVRERTTQQKLTSLAYFPGLLKVRLAKRSALGYIILANFVEQKIMLR